MTLTISPKPSPPRRMAHDHANASPNSERGRKLRRGVGRERGLLGRYIDWQGRRREVLAQGGAAGSILVIDRDAGTRRDARLVAHLASDEPPGNAALVCSRYIEDTQGARYSCRAVTAADLRTAPFDDADQAPLADLTALSDPDPIDACGRSYRLERLETGMSIRELRWRRAPSSSGEDAQVVSLREAVGCLESYEPLRALTARAVALHRCDTTLSTTTLRTELTRVQNSPIVLNRELREAVLRRVEREHLSMSEIAIRCGRVKRDGRGNESGETSWLARRLGLLPEAGQKTTTPWIHSDVLALIARRGLGISPREVEVT
jgi:hypothetical protein